LVSQTDSHTSNLYHWLSQNKEILAAEKWTTGLKELAFLFGDAWLYL